MAGWVGGKAEVVAEIYTNSSITREAGVSIGSIERLITSLLVFVFWTDLKEHVERGKIFINSFIVYLIWINLFWPFSIFIERLSLLLSLIYILGRTGRATTEHCQFEGRVNGVPFNSDYIFDHGRHALRKDKLTFTRKSNGTISVRKD